LDAVVHSLWQPLRPQSPTVPETRYFAVSSVHVIAPVPPLLEPLEDPLLDEPVPEPLLDPLEDPPLDEPVPELEPLTIPLLDPLEDPPLELLVAPLLDPFAPLEAPLLDEPPEDPLPDELPPEPLLAPLPDPVGSTAPLEEPPPLNGPPTGDSLGELQAAASPRHTRKRKVRRIGMRPKLAREAAIRTG
jgi:hypothetical protein